MSVLSLLVLCIAVVSPVYAVPLGLFPLPNVSSTNGAGVKDLLCRFPLIKEWVPLCPRQNGVAVNVVTPLGIAAGVNVGSGATRFAVKYASAARWERSAVATTWQLPSVLFHLPFLLKHQLILFSHF